MGTCRAPALAALDGADLGDVGLILISHAHRDHLSLSTLRRMPRGATLVVHRPSAARWWHRSASRTWSSWAWGRTWTTPTCA